MAAGSASGKHTARTPHICVIIEAKAFTHADTHLFSSALRANTQYSRAALPTLARSSPPRRRLRLGGHCSLKPAQLFEGSLLRLGALISPSAAHHPKQARALDGPAEGGGA